MNPGLHRLRKAVARHGAVCRVVVAETKGSAPREAGATMLVWRGGQSGTIGGGRLEFDAARQAADMLEAGTARARKVFALGPELGQCCGGAVTVTFETFTEGELPRDGEGGTTEAGGDTPLWIYGAGHVGRAIVGVMADLPGFAITWVDTAPDRFPDDVPEGVTILPAARPELAMRHAPPRAYHLVLTYSHEIDLALCHTALSQPTGGCGLIGSSTKWARFQRRLRDLGHQTAKISGITCPIGDPSLGKHPQAIAIGVAARLIDRQMHKDSTYALRGSGQ